MVGSLCEFLYHVRFKRRLRAAKNKHLPVFDWNGQWVFTYTLAQRQAAKENLRAEPLEKLRAVRDEIQQRMISYLDAWGIRINPKRISE